MLCLNNPDSVELLLKNGANLSLVNNAGDNLLHIYCKTIQSGDKVSYMKRLINYITKEMQSDCFSINQQNCDGNTPIMCAVISKQIRLISVICKFAIALNINYNLKNNNGQTLKDLFEFEGSVQPELKELLILNL